MARHQALGAAGEAAVAGWYERRGLVVLDRNWRCAEGELDLVVSVVGSQSWVVFCEVKTRTGSRHGIGSEAVDHRKRQRLRRLATAWLSAHPHGNSRNVRFDVASVDWNGRGFAITVIEAAF